MFRKILSNIHLLVLIVVALFMMQAVAHATDPCAATLTSHYSLAQPSANQVCLQSWPYGVDTFMADYNAAMTTIDTQLNSQSSGSGLAAGGVGQNKISYTGIKLLKGTGVASAGPVTLTGAVIGMRVIEIFGNLTAGGPMLVFVPGTDFETAITVTNQVQQLTGDLHLDTIVFLLVPATS